MTDNQSAPLPGSAEAIGWAIADEWKAEIAKGTPFFVALERAIRYAEAEGFICPPNKQEAT